MKHAFSIDLEDWYQGIELSQDNWKNKENRLEIGLDVVLNLLKEAKTKATFFCLGCIAEKNRNIIQRISNEGHEIASHGYSHEKVYNLSKSEFREDVRKTKGLLEDACQKKVVGNRSPYFTITAKTLWALDILDEEGYSYDASISPIKTWRYGIKNSPDYMYRVSGLRLIEFPSSTVDFFGKKIAMGGAYFRIFPYYFFNKAFKNAKSSMMFYAHPWEFDPYHPRIDFENKAKFTHYFNLKKMKSRVEKILNSYDFTTVVAIINNISDLPEISKEMLLDEEN